MKKTILICTILIVIILAALCYFGVLWPNDFFANSYSVQGVDVSNHQKEINWNQVAQNKKIKFAFIKATEGKNYKDKYFQTNWNGASEAKLYKGAYHYFTTTSSGKEQANNFIKLVPAEKGCLPPVIDIEENGLNKENFKKELSDFIKLIEVKYSQKPILYVVYSLYDEYIKGDFEQYPIWIRDVIKPPKLSDSRGWLFWQFSERARIAGVNTFVDMNVFNGDIEELKGLLS